MKRRHLSIAGIAMQARSWWANEATPRSRIALWVLLALILGLAGMELSERSDRLAIRLAEAAQQAALADEAATGPGWEARAEEASQALDRFNARLIAAPTSGLAAAQAQDELRQTLEGVGARNVRVSIDPNPIDTDGLVQLRFELQASFSMRQDPPEVLALLAGYRYLMVWDEFRLSFPRGRPITIAIRGRVPIRLTDSEPGSATLGDTSLGQAGRG